MKREMTYKYIYFKIRLSRVKFLINTKELKSNPITQVKS